MPELCFDCVLFYFVCMPNLKRNSLVEFAQATLGNEGMRQAVKVPLESKVSRQEWLALKTQHVYKDVLLILGAVRDGCCDEVKCKVMSSSPKFEYAWADEYGCPQPIRVTAPEVSTCSPHFPLSVLQASGFVGRASAPR